MLIRQFVKGIDDSLWASFLEIALEEFRLSMLDPEFSEDGMLIAEINGQVVGVINAHISPSCPKFCVLRNFKVLKNHWHYVAGDLLDAALGSFSQRGARIVKACFPETAKRQIALLKAFGFELGFTECKMKHELKTTSSLENANMQIRKYSEVNNPDLVIHLQNKAFKGLIGRPVTKEEFLFWIKNPLFECFIAFLEEKPVGSVFCELEREKKDKEKHGWIYGLGVLPNYRRLKIGTILLSKVLQFLKSAGANYVLVNTDYNSYQQRFYESAGFYVVRKIVCLQRSLSQKRVAESTRNKADILLV